MYSYCRTVAMSFIVKPLAACEVASRVRIESRITDGRKWFNSQGGERHKTLQEIIKLSYSAV